MQTTNARDPRPVPPDPTGRETSRAVMGQFSGGCYLSFSICVLLVSQVPATFGRGKLNTDTLFCLFVEEVSDLGVCGGGRVSVLRNKLNQKVCAMTDSVSGAGCSFLLK